MILLEALAILTEGYRYLAASPSADCARATRHQADIVRVVLPCLGHKRPLVRKRAVSLLGTHRCVDMYPCVYVDWCFLRSGTFLSTLRGIGYFVTSMRHTNVLHALMETMMPLLTASPQDTRAAYYQCLAALA